MQDVAAAFGVAQGVVGGGDVQQQRRRLGRGLQQQLRRQVGDNQADAGCQQPAQRLQRCLRLLRAAFVQREGLAGEAAGGGVVGEAEPGALDALIRRRRLDQRRGDRPRHAQG